MFIAYAAGAEGTVLKTLVYIPKKGQLEPDKKQLSLFLSCGKSEESAVCGEACRLLKGALAPRAAARFFALEGARLKGTEVVLSGNDIARHLSGCDGLWLMAATVGAEADALIERLKTHSLALYHAADTAASLAVETLCDEVEQKLREQAQAEGKALTPRFSCGYGDFPLTQQTALLGLLDAFKTAGITLGADLSLHPFKSVTAVMGVGESAEGTPFHCSDCRFNGVCSHKLCAR